MGLNGLGISENSLNGSFTLSLSVGSIAFVVPRSGVRALIWITRVFVGS